MQNRHTKEDSADNEENEDNDNTDNNNTDNNNNNHNTNENKPDPNEENKNSSKSKIKIAAEKLSELEITAKTQANKSNTIDNLVAELKQNEEILSKVGGFEFKIFSNQIGTDILENKIYELTINLISTNKDAQENESTKIRVTVLKNEWETLKSIVDKLANNLQSAKYAYKLNELILVPIEADGKITWKDVLDRLNQKNVLSNFNLTSEEQRYVKIKFSLSETKNHSKNPKEVIVNDGESNMFDVTISPANDHKIDGFESVVVPIKIKFDGKNPKEINKFNAERVFKEIRETRLFESYNSKLTEGYVNATPTKISDLENEITNRLRNYKIDNAFDFIKNKDWDFEIKIINQKQEDILKAAVYEFDLIIKVGNGSNLQSYKGSIPFKATLILSAEFDKAEKFADQLQKKIADQKDYDLHDSNKYQSIQLNGTLTWQNVIDTINKNICFYLNIDVKDLEYVNVRLSFDSNGNDSNIKEEIKQRTAVLDNIPTIYRIVEVKEKYKKDNYTPFAKLVEIKFGGFTGQQFYQKQEEVAKKLKELIENKTFEFTKDTFQVYWDSMHWENLTYKTMFNYYLNKTCENNKEILEYLDFHLEIVSHEETDKHLTENDYIFNLMYDTSVQLIFVPKGKKKWKNNVNYNATYVIKNPDFDIAKKVSWEITGIHNRSGSKIKKITLKKQDAHENNQLSLYDFWEKIDSSYNAFVSNTPFHEILNKYVKISFKVKNSDGTWYEPEKSKGIKLTDGTYSYMYCYQKKADKLCYSNYVYDVEVKIEE